MRRVASAGTREAFCAIGSVCFHVPITWFREVFDCASVWERFAGYVGYVSGPPPMVDAAMRLLMSRRLFPRNIYREDFFDESYKAAGGLASAGISVAEPLWRNA